MKNLILYFYWMQTKKNERERESSGSHNKNKVHIIGSLCPVDGFYACASAHIYKTTMAWNKKKWSLGRMRMHKLKLGKISNKDVHSSPRSVHCMCLCSRFIRTNYKISTCIMCTISVRHLVQMARAVVISISPFRFGLVSNAMCFM